MNEMNSNEHETRRRWLDGPVFVRPLTIIVTITLAMALATPGFAAINLLDNNQHKLGLYGFLKFDASYQDGGMNSRTAPRFARDGDESTDFTAMHSRFGLRWSGPTLAGGLAVGAVVEIDLFDSSRNQMDLRTRLAAFTLTKGKSSWLFGQHWDVFSPIGPTTLMTNGYFWQTGNLGFRRAQIRYTYASPASELAFSLNDPTNPTLADSGTPIVEGRFGWKFAKSGRFGISGAYGVDQRDRPEGRQEDVDVAGLSLDWVIPFGERVAFRGEAATGENLSVFLSRSGLVSRNGRLEGQEVLAYWAQLVYTGQGADFWIGAASEDLTDQNQVSSSTLEEALALFAGVKSKLGNGVSLGFEAAKFQSTLGSGREIETLQGLFSAIYSF